MPLFRLWCSRRNGKASVLFFPCNEKSRFREECFGSAAIEDRLFSTAEVTKKTIWYRKPSIQKFYRFAFILSSHLLKCSERAHAVVCYFHAQLIVLCFLLEIKKKKLPMFVPHDTLHR